MKKSTLTSLIEKYHLAGNIEQVVWKTENGKTTVDLMTPDKTLLGKITLDNTQLENSDLGIYETSKLLQMLGILDSDVDVKLTEVNSKMVSVKMSDRIYDMTFVLADTDIIPKAANLKQLPPMDVVVDIDSTFIDKFLKAFKGVSTEAVAFRTTEGQVEIIVGYSTTLNSNKVKFTNDAEVNGDIEPIAFNSTHLQQIMVANKGLSGKMEISSKGLMKLTFEGSDFHNEYYSVQQQVS